MTDQELGPLSTQTERQLEEGYRAEDVPTLRVLLLEYGTAKWHREVERVRFDVLHLAGGDPDRVRRLVELAKKDARDVMSGEYYRRDGRSIPHEWALRHDVNQRLMEKNSTKGS